MVLQRPHLCLRVQGAEAMAYLNIQPGQVLGVFYSDDTEWHERLALWRVQDGIWVLHTPDGDTYAEDLRGVPDGPAKVKIKGIDFVYWSRIGGPSYRFAQYPSEGDLKGLIRKGFEEAIQEEACDPAWRPSSVVFNGEARDFDSFFGGSFVTRRRGSKKPLLPVAAVPAVAAPPPAPVLRPIFKAPADKIWVAVENFGGYDMGQEIAIEEVTGFALGDFTGLIQVPGGWLKAELLGVDLVAREIERRRGEVQPPPGAGVTAGPIEEESLAAHVGADPDAAKDNLEDPGDARTLFIDHDSEGSRYKDWRQVAIESQYYSYSDWPLEGPATVHHLLRHTQKHGGDPRVWLQIWARQKQVGESDRVMHELRCLTDVLFYGGTFDQLNMPVLVSFEVVARRIASIVDAYQAGNSSPDWANAKIFSGHQGPEDLVMPSLKTWAARRGREEAEIFNARTKMRELRRGGAPAGAVADDVGDGSTLEPPGGGGPVRRPPRGGRGRGGRGLAPPGDK